MIRESKHVRTQKIHHTIHKVHTCTAQGEMKYYVQAVFTVLEGRIRYMVYTNPYSEQRAFTMMICESPTQRPERIWLQTIEHGTKAGGAVCPHSLVKAKCASS